MAERNDTSAPGEDPWGTLEELVLACAVSRHGTKSWDSIAMEVQSRSRPDFQAIISPQNCRRRFYQLRRRFADDTAGDEDSTVRDDITTMVDELRRLRVAELRLDVERRDVSIVSLRLKVKRLEEERERGAVKEGGKSESDLKEIGGAGDETPMMIDRNVSGESISSGSSSQSHDSRSFNESNSTNRKCDDLGSASVQVNSDPNQPIGTEPVEPGGLWSKPAWAFSACAHADDDSIPRDAASTERTFDAPNDSSECAGTAKNSDMQSSSSPSKTDNRPGVFAGIQDPLAGSPPGYGLSTAKSPSAAVKSQPPAEFLEILRAHKLSSAFERRLRSQEKEKYRSLILQHMDLQTIQSRVDEGAYAGRMHAFFRDLLLLFNNGVVFFPANSSEHVAAGELRKLVLKEMTAHASRSSRTDDQSEDAHIPAKKPGRHVDSGPMVVFRKRSSATTKSSESNIALADGKPAGEKSAAVKKMTAAGKPSSLAERNGDKRKSKQMTPTDSEESSSEEHSETESLEKRDGNAATKKMKCTSSGESKRRVFKNDSSSGSDDDDDNDRDKRRHGKVQRRRNAKNGVVRGGYMRNRGMRGRRKVGRPPKRHPPASSSKVPKKS